MAIESLKQSAIIQHIDEIRKSANLSLKIFCEIAGISEKDYRAALAHRKGFPIHAIFELCNFFKISVDRLFAGTVDLKEISNRFHVGISELPEKYKSLAFSKRRTSYLLLRYLDENYGRDFTN